MNRPTLPTEFIFQVFSLLIAFIIVHAFYLSTIRPQAAAFLEYEQHQLLDNPDYIQKRNFYVVIKDYEQESCFILMLWAFAILGFKAVISFRQRKMLMEDLLQLPSTLPIGLEDTRRLVEKLTGIQGTKSRYLLPRALKLGIQRFGVTGNIQDSADAVRDLCGSEMERQESELSIIRYIAWAIPSIGFIGTVRGIGAALSHANKAVEGDITGVTQSLGVAFNSTFIALVISIILMFFIHQLQLVQERVVLDTEAYCNDNLVARMRVTPLS